jgi:hypothetical protein
VPGMQLLTEGASRLSGHHGAGNCSNPRRKR